MSDVADLLTASEAAVVSCVSLRDVNRAIDEHILPRAFMPSDGARMVEAAGCALISFYFALAKRLTAEERLLLIARVGPKLLAAGLDVRPHRKDWAFGDAFLTIDLAPFLIAAKERFAMLAAARAMVTASPDVLSGTPVLRSTRVPVHDVAASLAAGQSPEEVLAAYPSLEATQLELCSLYAAAYPLRGRPRVTTAPDHATVLVDRRLPRRKVG